VNAMPVSTVGLTSCPAFAGMPFRLVLKDAGVPSVTISGEYECGPVRLQVPRHAGLELTDTDGRVFAAATLLPAEG
jgi:hypothetical protein